MSRTTRNINYITKELDRISGLDGIVADKTEKLAIEVHEMVEDILDNHANASIFDYEGKGEKLICSVRQMMSGHLSGEGAVLSRQPSRSCHRFRLEP